MSNLVWCSFADPTRPTGTQFLGVAIVRAHTPGLAPLVCTLLGINPGGEVVMQELHDVLDVPVGAIGRLLDAPEARALLRELEGQKVNPAGSLTVGEVSEWQRETGLSIQMPMSDELYAEIRCWSAARKRGPN